MSAYHFELFSFCDGCKDSITKSLQGTTIIFSHLNGCDTFNHRHSKGHNELSVYACYYLGDDYECMWRFTNDSRRAILRYMGVIEHLENIGISFPLLGLVSTTDLKK